VGLGCDLFPGSHQEYLRSGGAVGLKHVGVGLVRVMLRRLGAAVRVVLTGGPVSVPVYQVLPSKLTLKTSMELSRDWGYFQDIAWT